MTFPFARKLARASGEDLLPMLALAHGGYYVVTGLWPVFSIGTFQALTGRKRDLWLVKTAGLLIASIGVALVSAGYRGAVSPEIRLLGAASALSLAGIDVVYAGRGTISPIYLADAAGELALAAAWGVGRPRPHAQ